MLPASSGFIFRLKNTFSAMDAPKRLLIDGYNLLNSRSFPTPAHLDLEGQRDHLARVLNSYAAKKNLRVTLVFDNSQKPSREVSRHKRLKIMFSAPGQEADDLIKKLIRQEKTPAELTVVSSDRAIRFAAKDHGVSSLSSEEFCSLMRSDGGSGSSAVTAAQVAKYESEMGEEEVQFWKNLFERKRRDE
ncbi:MAG: NYN domain-containing protein [Calditrichaceae bacterium]|nr:NYN domain-containing protein [Calditrichia bacterium]NUQ43674.1 NYN domain-containing protein [Calditrichaceae bacterium]